MQGQSLGEGCYVGVSKNWCVEWDVKLYYTIPPRTGVIAHVHPGTSVSKQQTHQLGEPIWHAFFTQFVKKISVPDSVGIRPDRVRMFQKTVIASCLLL